MKICFTSNDEFSIFVNSLYFRIKDYNNKEEIISKVKDILLKVKSKLKLRGFYKIKVYCDSRVGIFIDGVRIDDSNSNVLDLRVIVYLDCEIYFKTDDYFLIKDCKNIRYYRDNFYCLANDISDINEVIEFGEFVYGDMVLEMLDNSCVV